MGPHRIFRHGIAVCGAEHGFCVDVQGLGIGDAQIALWTSLIMMPWTLKFLWSPFLEMFKTKKFFVVLTQMVTGAGFALVALALQLPFFLRYALRCWQ